MKKLTRVLLAILSVLSCLTLSAQTGAYPYATLDNRGFDSINVGNSNMRFTIPIVSRSGRGLPFNYAIQYEGMIWTAVPSAYGNVWSNDPSWGFHGALNGAVLGGTLLYFSNPAGSCPGGSANYKVYKTSNYVFTDSLGTSHHMRYSTTIDCNGNETSSGDGSTADGSGYVLINEGSQVQSRGGLIITPAIASYAGDTGAYAGQYAAVSDANGNTVSTSGNGIFTDTLGVTALQVGGGAQPTTFTYPVSGQSDGATSTTSTISYGSFTVQTNFQAPGVSDVGPFTNVSLPTQITLADGSAYHFTYEATPGVSGAVTGRLASVQLPNGGTIGYSYPGCYGGGGMNPDGSPCVLQRTTSTGTKGYYHYPATASPYVTYTIDEASNETDYSFQLSTNGNAYEVHHTAYQGSGPYLGNNSPQSLTEHDVYYNQDWGRSQTIAAINQVDVADAQNGMRLSHTATFLNAAGLPTEFDEFDWHDNLVRQTSSAYNSHNKLTDLLVKGFSLNDNSQGILSHTSYGYDETAAIGTGGNIPQHGTPSASPGNQTSVHQWLNGTDCNNSTDRVNCVTTTTAYYDTGAVQSVTSPSGTVSYSYDPTQTFVTGTGYPMASSGVALSTSATYDSTSTAVTSATGYNPGQAVAVASYDRRMRPTHVNMPDGGSSSLGYSPGQSTVQRAKSSSDSAWTSVQYDGYGRVTRTAVANGFGGYYITDTCYGAEGRAVSVTIPYATNTAYGAYDCSQPHESYSYDALGRVTNVTHADGTQRNYAYLIFNGAFSTKTTDELGKTNIVDTDALGRQVIACEVTWNPLPNSDNPTQCNTAIGATGYKTTFAYTFTDPYHFRSSIYQGVQGRHFIVDMLGRSWYTYEPERGETSYSYAYQSNGQLLVTRTRAAANYTDCTVRASDGFCDPNHKTNTTYTYDVMGRLTDTTYTDASSGATVQPWRRFWYDVTIPGSTFNASNARGLLTQAKIESYDSNYSMSRYSYDMMGRPVQTFDCTTGWCGQGQTGEHRAFYRWYDYDLMGNKIHEIWNFGAYDQDSRTVGLTSAWSPAGELLSLAGGLGNVQYWAGNRGAQGNLDEQYGNGVQATFAYDVMNRQTGRWACLYTTHAGCAAGTHLEGSLAFFTGDKVTRLINEQGDNTLGYDDLGRLSSRFPTGGSGPTLNWTYDRYGNRLNQTAGGTGGSAPQISLNINPYDNKVNGYTYDLAGNVLSDGVHSYTYDQEGNLIYVDNGQTAWDNYDALNRRILHATGNYTNYLRYEYGIDGKLAGVWQNEETYEKLNRYYGPKGDSFAYWTGGTNLSNEVVHYQHTDYLGTVKARTDQNHNVEAYYVDLPFGERAPDLIASTDDNTEHYATLDRDTESDTHHAQFRTYEPRIGRWLQPDPYDGSYSMSMPQSWNRYSYVLNNPLGFGDSSGMDLPGCEGEDCDGGDDGYGGYGGGGLGGFGGGGDDGGEDGQAYWCGPTMLCTSTTGTSDPPTPPPPPPPDPGIPCFGNCGIGSGPQNPVNAPDPGSSAPNNGFMFAQGKGERGQTSKPNNPTKGVRAKVENGKVVGWTIPNSQTGKRIDKSLQWGIDRGLNPNDPKWLAMAAAGAGAAAFWELLEGVGVLLEALP